MSKIWIGFSLAVVLVVGSSVAKADDDRVEDGFRSLFNGRDLTGWEYGPVPVSQKPINFSWMPSPKAG
jgi:hypothetical protein